ncbi:hypothetical protein L209DRAFT_361527 [Thermothelomyces heterothallicus CBS 203.75]
MPRRRTPDGVVPIPPDWGLIDDCSGPLRSFAMGHCGTGPQQCIHWGAPASFDQARCTFLSGSHPVTAWSQFFRSLPQSGTERHLREFIGSSYAAASYWYITSTQRPLSKPQGMIVPSPSQLSCVLWGVCVLYRLQQKTPNAKRGWWWMVFRLLANPLSGS